MDQEIRDGLEEPLQALWKQAINDKKKRDFIKSEMKDIKETRKWKEELITASVESLKTTLDEIQTFSDREDQKGHLEITSRLLYITKGINHINTAIIHRWIVNEIAKKFGWKND